MFELSNKLNGAEYQKEFDRMYEQGDKLKSLAVAASLQVAMQLGNMVKSNLLALRYQRDNTSMIEMTKGDETVFRGRTGQNPEISKVDEAGYQQIKAMTEQPVGTELQFDEPLDNFAIKVDDKVMFAVENNRVTTNKMLTPEQSKVLDTAEKVVDRYGEMSEDGGSINYFGKTQNGPYNISATPDNFTVTAADDPRRVIVDAKGEKFEAEPIDFETFSKAAESLETQAKVQQSVVEAAMELG
jgi:hypothetical protein